MGRRLRFLPYSQTLVEIAIREFSEAPVLDMVKRIIVPEAALDRAVFRQNLIHPGNR
jgi:hypothetical protein